MKPLVSVILPVRNGADLIHEALMSVEAALQEVEHEIIIIDDGSSDNLKSVLATWQNRIIYVSQNPSGVSVARNKGLQQARGQYVAFIDADDIWSLNHFTFLLETLKKNKSHIILGYTQRFEVNTNNKKREVKKNLGSPFLFPSLGAGLFKKSVFDKVGVLEPMYELHEDIDWYLRVIEEEIKLVVVPEVVLYYRIHAKNSTKSWQPTDKRILQVLAKSLKRRKYRVLPALNSFEV